MRATLRALLPALLLPVAALLPTGSAVATAGPLPAAVTTTASATCDQAARTITAGATGAGYAASAPVRVNYFWTGTSQPRANEPGFTRHPSYPYPDASHVVTTSTTGTWSNVGYVLSITSNPYYLDHRFVVEVRDAARGTLLGRAEASCVYAGHRP